MTSQDSLDESSSDPSKTASNFTSGGGTAGHQGTPPETTLKSSSIRAHLMAGLLGVATVTIMHYAPAFIPPAREYKLIDLVPLGYVTFCGYVVLGAAVLFNSAFRLLIGGRGWSRRDVLPLYTYYTRLAVTGIVCAALAFYFAAGFLAGDLEAVLVSLGAAVSLAVFIYVSRRFDLSRRLLRIPFTLLWRWIEYRRRRPQEGPLITRDVLRLLLPLRRRLLPPNSARRAYVVATALAAVSTPFFLVLMLLGAARELSLPLAGLVLSAVFFAAGAAVEVINSLLRLWATTVGKFFLGLLAGFVVNASYVFARQEVNSITRIDPSSFNTAVATIAALLTPIVWVGVVFIALVLMLILNTAWAAFYPGFEVLPFQSMYLIARNSTLYRFLFNKQRVDVRPLSPYVFARIPGVMGLMIVFLMPLVLAAREGGRLRAAFTELFLATETYADSRCAKQHAGERVAFIGDGKILAVSGRPGSYVFEVRSCD